MHIAESPIASGDGFALQQPGKSAARTQKTIDRAVAKEHGVVLSEVLIDANVVLVLRLGYGGGVKGVAIGAGIVGSGRRENGLCERYHARVNETGRDDI